MSDYDQQKMLRLMRANEDRQRQTETKEVLFTDHNTYTPTYLGGTTPGATTYTAQVGAWWQIGSVVVVTGQVAWSAATGTGNAQVSLPFTAAGYPFSGSLRLQNVTFANSAPEMQISASTAYFEMVSPLSNNVPTPVAVEAAGNIIFTAVYAIA